MQFPAMNHLHLDRTSETLAPGCDTLVQWYQYDGAFNDIDAYGYSKSVPVSRGERITLSLVLGSGGTTTSGYGEWRHPSHIDYNTADIYAGVGNFGFSLEGCRGVRVYMYIRLQVDRDEVFMFNVLSTPGTVQPGESSVLDVIVYNWVYDHIYYYPHPLTFTVQNPEYGFFLNTFIVPDTLYTPAENVLFGDVINGYFAFVPGSDYPWTLDQTIVPIQVRSSVDTTITGDGVVRVEAPEPTAIDHLHVTTISDTLYPGDPLAIAVTAKDSSGSTLPWEPSQTVIVRVAGNRPVRLLRNTPGSPDTLSAPITVPYSVLRDTSLALWLPGDTLYRDTAGVAITAIAEDDTTVRGEVTIPSIDPLRVEWTFPAENISNDSVLVWPTIPEAGLPTAVRTSFFDSVNVENTLDPMTLEFTDEGAPVPGQPFHVESFWVQGSGGHAHGDENNGSNDHIPPHDVRGWLFPLNGVSPDSSREYIDKSTDAAGSLQLRYRALEFGGEIRFLIKTTYQDRHLDIWSDTVYIRVPGLELLEEQTGNDFEYELVGGTYNHPGPDDEDDTPNPETPNTNHWGTPGFVDSLQALADTWTSYAADDSVAVHSNESPLRINDMSLPSGGKFDVNGEWTGDHQYHRVGRDADVRITRVDPPGSWYGGVLLKRTEVGDGVIYKSEKFEELCLDNRIESAIHDRSSNNEHYHLYFYEDVGAEYTEETNHE